MGALENTNSLIQLKNVKDIVSSNCIGFPASVTKILIEAAKHCIESGNSNFEQVASEMMEKKNYGYTTVAFKKKTVNSKTKIIDQTTKLIKEISCDIESIL